MPTEISLRSPDGCLDYVAIAFYAWRRFPAGLRQIIWRRWETEDIRQSCYLAAVAAWRENLDFRAAYNLAQREIYACLRALGFRRAASEGMRYVRREVSFAYLRGEKFQQYKEV